MEEDKNAPEAAFQAVVQPQPDIEIREGYQPIIRKGYQPLVTVQPSNPPQGVSAIIPVPSVQSQAQSGEAGTPPVSHPLQIPVENASVATQQSE